METRAQKFTRLNLVDAAGSLPDAAPAPVPAIVPDVLPPAPDLHTTLQPDVVSQPIVSAALPAPVPVPPPSILPPAPDHGMAAPDLLPAVPDLAPSPAQIQATAQHQAAQAAQADAVSGRHLSPVLPVLHVATPDVQDLPITVSVPATTMVRHDDGSVSEVATTPALAQLHVAQAGSPLADLTPAQQAQTAATPAMQDAAIVSGPVSPTTAAEAGVGSSSLGLFLLLGAGLWFLSGRKGRR